MTANCKIIVLCRIFFEQILRNKRLTLEPSKVTNNSWIINIYFWFKVRKSINVYIMFMSTTERLAEQLLWYLVYLASLSLTATATSWASSSQLPTATATHSRLPTATHSRLPTAMPTQATVLSPAAAEAFFPGRGATFYPPL